MHRFKTVSLTVFLVIVVILQGCKSKSRNSIDVLSASKVAQQLTLSDNYAYSSLTAEEKQAYNIIYDTILNFNKKADIKNIDEDKIKKAFFYVLKDHPEIFWSDGYTYVTSYVNNEISGHRIIVREGSSAPADGRLHTYRA